MNKFLQHNWPPFHILWTWSASWNLRLTEEKDVRLLTTGTLHLKSRQRRREIYFPEYIYRFVLSIEKRLGMNCPNLGKIIERRWSDDFTRLSIEWSSSRGCTNVGAYFFWRMQTIEILVVTSFPYFGVKLSCVCLLIAYRKNCLKLPKGDLMLP